MATLRQLERRLNQVVQRLNVGIGVVVATVGSTIGQAVVIGPPGTGSPVKTGFTRGNWRPSLNAPAEGPLAFLDPSGAATVAKIRAVASRYRPGDVLFIVNHTPYIGLLNRGHSPQAPAGYIQAAVRFGTERALAAFQNGILNVRASPS